MSSPRRSSGQWQMDEPGRPSPDLNTPEPQTPRTPGARAARPLSLSTLLSDLAARAASAQPPAPAAGFYAAATLVDVSACQSAAERMTERGRTAVGGAVLRCFARIARAAAREAADVVQFLGDSVLVLVRAEGEEGLPDAGRAAVRVALGCLGLDADGASTEAPPSPHTPASRRASLATSPREAAAEAPQESFRMHAAVAAGRFFALRLPAGLIAVGPATARLAKAAALARGQQICLAPEVSRTASCGALPLRQRTRDGYGIYGGAVPAASPAPAPGDGPHLSPSFPASASTSPHNSFRGRRGTAPEGLSEALAVLARRRASAFSELGTPWALGALERGPATAEPAGEERAALLALLPRDVRALAEGGTWPAMDLRPITCAYVRIDGFAAGALDPADVEFPREKLQWLLRCSRVVAGAVDGAEGVLRGAFCPDSGGVCCVATWGAIGPTATPADAARACEAALAIHAAFRDEGLGPVSVGLATAPSLCGLLGDDSRAEFACVGRACALAARLMAAASGAVWADAETRAAAGPALAAEEVELPEQRGAAWRATGCFRLEPRREERRPAARPLPRSLSLARRTSASFRLPPEQAPGPPGEGVEAEAVAERLTVAAASPESGLFGRREALALVVDLVAAARTGGPGWTLFLEAPQGHGKTMLAAEAERLAELVGVPVLAVQPDPKNMYPYEAVRALLSWMVKGDKAGEREEKETAPAPAQPHSRLPPLTMELWETGESEDETASPRPRLSGPRLSEGKEEPARRPSECREGPEATPRSWAETVESRLAADAAAFLAGVDGKLATVPNTRTLARFLSDAPWASSPTAAAPAARRVASSSSTPHAGGMRPPPSGASLQLSPLPAPASHVPVRSRSPSIASGVSSQEPERSPADALAADFILTPNTRQHRLFTLLATLLQAALRRLSALLIVDDLYALDAASMKLLSFLAHSSPCYVLVTSRPVPEHTVCAEYGLLRRGDRTRLLQLRPLETVEEVRGYVAHFLKVKADDVSEFLARRLKEKSGGSPFALGEMAAHLLRCGLIEVDNGRVLAGVSLLDSRRSLRSRSSAGNSPGGSLREGEGRPDAMSDEGGDGRPLPLPESLQSAAVLSHLDRVPTLAALVMKLCSALGPRFEAGLAQYAVEGVVEWRATAACLLALERHGLLQRVQMPSGLHEYAFVQPSHAEVLRTVLSREDAAFVRWRSAEYFARTDFRRPRAVAATIAEHYAEAGARELAAPYLDIAAEVAVEEGRYADGLALAAQALAASYGKPISALDAAQRGQPRAPAWAAAAARRWQLHARALFALGRAAEALASAETCLRVLGAPLGGRPAAGPLRLLAARLRARLELAAGPAPAGQRRGPKREEKAPDNSLRGALAHASAPLPEQRAAALGGALAVLVPLLVHAGEPRAAVLCALEAVRVAGGRPAEAEARLDALALAAATLHGLDVDPPLARRLAEAARRAAAARGAAGRVSRPHVLGELAGQLLAADFLSFDRAVASAASRLRTTGDAWGAAEAHLLGGTGHLLRGNAFDAARAFDAVIRLARASENRLQLLWGLVGWASGELESDGGEAAAVAAGVALAEARGARVEERYPLEALALHGATARARALEGAPDEAEAEALAGVEALRALRRRGLPPPLPLALVPLCQLADVLLELLEGGYEARRAAAPARAPHAALAYGGPLLASFAARHRTAPAGYGESAGSWERCLRAALEEVLAALRGAGAAFALAAAPAAYFEGRWQAREGSARRARAAMERARRLALATGLRPWLERAEAAAGSLGSGSGPRTPRPLNGSESAKSRRVAEWLQSTSRQQQEGRPASLAPF